MRMSILPLNILKKYAAKLLQCVMVLIILVAVISIPWFIASATWDFLIMLMHQQPVLFILLLVPTLYLSFKLWLWLYELTGAFLMSVGSLVDKLEGGKK